MQPISPELSSADRERIQNKSFHDDPLLCAVSRMISLAIKRKLRGRQILPEDVFQECYTGVKQDFAAIYDKFLVAENMAEPPVEESARPATSLKTEEGFHAFLSVVISRRVVDILRR